MGSHLPKDAQVASAGVAEVDNSVDGAAAELSSIGFGKLMPHEQFSSLQPGSEEGVRLAGVESRTVAVAD